MSSPTKRLKKTCTVKDDNYLLSSFSKEIKISNEFLLELPLYISNLTQYSDSLDADITFQLSQLAYQASLISNIKPKTNRVLPNSSKFKSKSTGSPGEVYTTYLDTEASATFLNPYSSVTQSTGSTKFRTNDSNIFQTFSVKPSLYLNTSFSKDTLVSRDSSGSVTPIDDSISNSIPISYNHKSDKILGLTQPYPRKTSLPNPQEINRINFMSDFNFFSRKGSGPKTSSITVNEVSKGADLIGWMTIYRNNNSILPSKQWKKKFIVFKEITLYRFDSNTSTSQCSEILQLNPQSIVCVTNDFPDQKLVLSINNPGRSTFFLKAETSMQLTSWLNTLKAAVVRSSYLMRGLPPIPQAPKEPYKYINNNGIGKVAQKKFSMMITPHQYLNIR